jgi:hypothetical protein
MYPKRNKTRSLSSLRLTVIKSTLAPQDSSKTLETHFLSRTLSSLFYENDSNSINELQEMSLNMNVTFKGIIISVSAFSSLPILARFFKGRKKELGGWSRKTKVSLEIGNEYIRETNTETGQVLAIIMVQDMKFALTKFGKRYADLLLQARYNAKQLDSTICSPLVSSLQYEALGQIINKKKSAFMKFTQVLN